MSNVSISSTAIRTNDYSVTEPTNATQYFAVKLNGHDSWLYSTNMLLWVDHVTAGDTVKFYYTQNGVRAVRTVGNERTKSAGKSPDYDAKIGAVSILYNQNYRLDYGRTKARLNKSIEVSGRELIATLCKLYNDKQQYRGFALVSTVGTSVLSASAIAKLADHNSGKRGTDKPLEMDASATTDQRLDALKEITFAGKMDGAKFIFTVEKNGKRLTTYEEVGRALLQANWGRALRVRFGHGPKWSHFYSAFVVANPVGKISADEIRTLFETVDQKVAIEKAIADQPVQTVQPEDSAPIAQALAAKESARKFDDTVTAYGATEEQAKRYNFAHKLLDAGKSTSAHKLLSELLDNAIANDQLDFAELLYDEIDAINA
ncbi:MAG: hypothetical protein UZ22_OP11002000307 [Microgenomates bacterium OLB23]|nr:MAG: hypothetical protein UZ22_OP11002000307 [Microgenomates bacterium OLB23]